MIKIISTFLMVLWSLQVWAEPTPEQPDRNIKFYNLQGSLGLKGYDPVGYFMEHGGQALKGESSISTIYGGVTYFFATVENRELFLQNPTKYEPTYGAWCAWGIANNGFVQINPLLFIQNGNRMHFFFSPGTLDDFNEDVEMYEGLADGHWKTRTGEEPRL